VKAAQLEGTIRTAGEAMTTMREKFTATVDSSDTAGPAKTALPHINVRRALDL
jgi:hypothetical protein